MAEDISEVRLVEVIKELAKEHLGFAERKPIVIGIGLCVLCFFAEQLLLVCLKELI